MRTVKIFIVLFFILLIGIIREVYGFLFVNVGLLSLINFFWLDPLCAETGIHPVYSFLLNHPNWFPTALALVLMGSLTTFLLYTVFEKKYVVKVSLLFYAVLGSVGAISGGLSLYFHNYGSLYESPQRIKYLLEHPFVLLILFPLFYFIEKSTQQSSARPVK